MCRTSKLLISVSVTLSEMLYDHYEQKLSENKVKPDQLCKVTTVELVDKISEIFVRDKFFRIVFQMTEDHFYKMS